MVTTSVCVNLRRVIIQTHETSGVGWLSADLTVNSDSSLHQNLGDFTASQSVLKTVADDDTQRKALSKLVGARAGTRGEDTTQFVQHPVLRSINTFQMFLRSSRL